MRRRQHAFASSSGNARGRGRIVARLAATLAALLVLVAVVSFEWGRHDNGARRELVRVEEGGANDGVGRAASGGVEIASEDDAAAGTARRPSAARETESEREHRRGWSERIGAAGRIVGAFEVVGHGRLVWDEVVLHGDDSRAALVDERRARALLAVLRDAEVEDGRCAFALDGVPPGAYELRATAVVERDDSETLRAHLFRAAFEVQAGSTTELGVVRDDHPVHEIDVVVRDLGGDPLDPEDLFAEGEWRLYVFSRERSGEPSHADAISTPDAFFAASDEVGDGVDDAPDGVYGRGFARELTTRRGRILFSIPDGLDTHLLVQSRWTGSPDGWALRETWQLLAPNELDGASTQVPWIAYRTAPFELELAVEESNLPPTFVHLAFVDDASGIAFQRSCDLVRVDETATAATTVHRAILDDAPVGHFRLLGRAGWIGRDDDGGGWSPRIEPSPVALGVLVDAAVDVGIDAAIVHRCTARQGATIEGRVAAGTVLSTPSISLRPVDASLVGASASTSVERADDGEAPPWRITGLLPNTPYLVGDGGRVVTTGAEGSTQVVELDASDFPER